MKFSKVLLAAAALCASLRASAQVTGALGGGFGTFLDLSTSGLAGGSVATLVVGGIGSRADLPFERMDDLQLAVLSALDAADQAEVTLEVDADENGVSLALGPVRDGSGDDEGLGLVLSRLVDDVTHERRDGGEWFSLRLSRADGA